MRIFWNVMGGLLAVGWALVAADYFIGAKQGKLLKDSEPFPADEEAPPLSVVIAACNEEEKLPQAFRTLIAQDYPGELEIVAVDDRSTDNTPALIDALAVEGREQGKEITVLHLSELPAGWLGKNHALYQGVENSKGRYVLFADADIHFATDTLSRAVHLMEREGLQHLAAFPELFLKGAAESIFGLTFSYLFFLKYRPWRVRDPKSDAYLGVGAFNMVRRDAYESIGTHRAIALEVADDMELGHRLKAAGFRCDVVGAAGFIGVRWQEGFAGLFNGLIKNAYAGLGYSPLTAIKAIVQLSLGVFVPVVGLFLATDKRAKAGYAFATLAFIAGGINHAREAKIPVYYALALPLSPLLLIAVIFRSAYVTEKNGGISWRGTFYPIEVLRAGAVPALPPIVLPVTE